ncbi:hypothetical protein [Actinoplanes sp. NPDC049265]|uniref:hypothetical protein n=1 Tax=Actinoplanes sp. NPDC049265 TaxID=3363902 RepID=UPI0037185347
MAVTILPEVGVALRTDQGVSLMVRSGDPDVAAAMAGVRDELGRLTAGGERVAYLSPVIALPGAYLLVVDFGSLPAEPVLTVPSLLGGWLRDGGVDDAEVGLGRPGRLGELEGYGPAARAYLRGGSAVPVDPVLDWLGDGDLTLLVYGVEAHVPAGEVRPAVDRIPADRTLVSGDPGVSLRAATLAGPVSAIGADAAALVAAGRDAAPVEVAAQMRAMREVLRRHTGALDRAGVLAEPHTRRVLFPGTGDGAIGPAWWQYFSAGAIRRRGGVPDGATTRPDGGVELTVGVPEQWLPGHPDGPAVRAAAAGR